jgi:hypothetical protein
MWWLFASTKPNGGLLSNVATRSTPAFDVVEAVCMRERARRDERGSDEPGSECGIS